jgi:hypothetical protein
MTKENIKREPLVQIIILKYLSQLGEEKQKLRTMGNLVENPVGKIIE